MTMTAPGPTHQHASVGAAWAQCIRPDEELTEASPLADQPPGSALPLKPHQLALLHKCLRFENGTVTKTMRTSMGIIGDGPGSGKSFVVLGLILSQLATPPVAFESVSSYAKKRVVVSEAVAMEAEAVHTSAIVVPFDLLSQWEAHVKKYAPHLRTMLIDSTRSIVALETVDLAALDLLLVTNTCLNRTAVILDARKVVLRRVVYDDADSVHMPNNFEIPSAFLWFVTSAYGNLLFPRGHYIRGVRVAAGIHNSGFVDEIWWNVCCAMQLDQAKRLVVKNADAFVERCMGLPAIERRILSSTCKTTVITECLALGDVAGAIQRCVPGENKGSEDDVLQILLQGSLEKEKRYAARLASLERQNQCQSPTQSQDRTESDKIETKLAAIRKYIGDIRARVSESPSICGICLCEPRFKTVTRCCCNTYCFQCLCTWFANSSQRNTASSCPSCRQIIGENNVVVVDSTRKNANDRPKEEEEGPSGDKDKDANFGALLKRLMTEGEASGERPRLIVLLPFEFRDSDLASMRALGLRYSFVRGNRATTGKTLRGFRNGDIDAILFVSPGGWTVNWQKLRGLDMCAATDVIMFQKLDTDLERHVIGRAHRMGRARGPLRAWHLLYEHEISESSLITS